MKIKNTFSSYKTPPGQSLPHQGATSALISTCKDKLTCLKTSGNWNRTHRFSFVSGFLTLRNASEMHPHDVCSRPALKEYTVFGQVKQREKGPWWRGATQDKPRRVAKAGEFWLTLKGDSQGARTVPRLQGAPEEGCDEERADDDGGTGPPCPRPSSLCHLTLPVALGGWQSSPLSPDFSSAPCRSHAGVSASPLDPCLTN